MPGYDPPPLILEYIVTFHISQVKKENARSNLDLDLTLNPYLITPVFSSRDIR